LFCPTEPARLRSRLGLPWLLFDRHRRTLERRGPRLRVDVAGKEYVGLGVVHQSVAGLDREFAHENVVQRAGVAADGHPVVDA